MLYDIVWFLAFQDCSLCALISSLFHLSCNSACIVCIYFQWLNVNYHSLVQHQLHLYNHQSKCFVGLASCLLCLLLWFVIISMHIIYRLNILSFLIRSVFVNVSVGWPVLLTICCLRYCSVVINILQMCLVLHFITLLLFITLTLYHCPL